MRIYLEVEKMETPYIGFSNDQIDKAKKLGEYWECPICHKKEKVQHSEPPLLDFVEHGGKTLLVGIRGKDISKTPTSCHGKISEV